MSLSSAPTFTVGSAGNLVSSQTCTNGTPINQVFYVGVSGQSGAAGSISTGSAVAARLQFWSTPTSNVSTTNGCQVQVWSTSDGTNYDTLAYGFSATIPSVASTVARESFDLPPGQYKLNVTNLDTSYTITVEATLGTTA